MSTVIFWEFFGSSRVGGAGRWNGRLAVAGGPTRILRQSQDEVGGLRMR